MMKYELYGAIPVPGKKTTSGYTHFETDNIKDLVAYINTHAVVPCELKPMPKKVYKARMKTNAKPAKITDFSTGYKHGDFVGEIYPWIRLDIDKDGEAEIVDKALKGLTYIKKPSTSHDKSPYKWHYLIPVEGTFQDYNTYKEIYGKFLAEYKLDLKDTSLKSVVQNMNPYGLKGSEITKVNSGKIWVLPKLTTSKGDKKAAKRSHSDINKKEIKKALKNLDPNCSYEDWLEIGFAVFDWNPNEEGFNLWDKWSQGGDNYDGTTTDKWEDFEQNASGDVTVGTLFHKAHGEKVDPLAGFKASGKKIKKTKKGKSKAPALKIIDKKEKKKAREDLLDQELEAIEREKGEIEYDPMLFPVEIRKYMQESAEGQGLNFSSTVPYTMMLLSQMLGDRVKIKMSGSWYSHVPIVWGLNVARPGIGKSPVIKKLSFPLIKKQKKYNKEFEEAMEGYHLDLDDHRVAVKKGEQSKEPKKPIRSVVVVDNITSQALIGVLDHNKEGVLFWKDELKGLFSAKDNNKDTREHLKSAWDGTPINSITKTVDSNFAFKPYVRVGGNVQPDVIKEILNDNKSGLNADGFMERFALIAHLKRVRNIWSGEDDHSSRDAFSKEKYAAACKKLSKSKEKLLTLDHDAEKLLRSYMAQSVRDIEESTSAFEEQYINKAGSLLGSLIAILHEISAGKNEIKVKELTVKKAIAITETARDNATYLYGTEKREEVAAEIAENVIEQWLESETGTKHLGESGQEMSAGDIANKYLNKKVTTQQVVEYFEESSKYNVLKHGRGHRIVKS